MKIAKFLLGMFVIFVCVCTGFAGTEYVIYDSGDVQKSSYVGDMAVTVNYTDATITDPATKIELSSFEYINIDADAGQDLGIGATFSVDVYGDGSNTDIRFNFYVYPFDDSRFYVNVPIDFTGWHNVTIDLADMAWYSPSGLTQEEALNGEVGIFQLQGPWGGNPGTIYIDNAELIIETLTYDEEENLLQNGDAEADIDFQHWYYAGYPDYAYESYTDSATYGSESFVLDNTSDVWQEPSMRSLAVPTEPNEPYLLKFWYKTMPGFNMISSEGVKANIRTWTANYGIYTGGTNIELPVTDGEWVQVIEEVVTPSDPRIVLLDLEFSMNLFGIADGVLLIDEIELYDTHCPLAAEEEMINNGSFETGDLTSYHTIANAGVIDTDSSDGTYALQFDADAVATIVSNNVSVSGIDGVIYSFDVKTPAGVTASASFVKVRFYDQDTASWVGELITEYPYTDGQWITVNGKSRVPAGADLMDVFIRWDGTDIALFDNLSVMSAFSKCDATFGFTELGDLVNVWLEDGFLPLLADNSMDDFEGYTDQSALENKWLESSGFYASTGSPAITLITDPAQTHSGNRALRFEYDNTGSGLIYSEFHTTLSSAIDLSQYNEMHVWMNRHPGNSLEDIFYVKFLSAFEQTGIKAEAWIDDPDGSTQSPTGWTKWVIDLDNLTLGNKADLTEIVGYFFGAVGQGGIGNGTGTIDIDDIVLVNTKPNCGTAPAWDMNDDCIVNLEDFAILAESWISN